MPWSLGHRTKRWTNAGCPTQVDQPVCPCVDDSTTASSRAIAGPRDDEAPTAYQPVVPLLLFSVQAASHEAGSITASPRTHWSP
jgi:hypothetical protein